ncbi:hypothetical protein M407DRAFT_31282 [Tulasnella calospora MUT 4182]|uniref:Uncharacterized protein n=1 Tax=Tulasnella calospora MUT 4182 TaxID=1051891 RepID=A0A0C3Q6S2_9AGAM|nr:hypothetical protein M407DRAFT_31282 [Tulasnella calospora MUT 4182]
MDEQDSDQLQFRRRDAAECKTFIAALLKLAFAQGKQRDDRWMADSAAARMADDALVWWNKLGEEVQGSWKLLSQAMLSEYRPMFYGGSGEEAEKFILAVLEKAIEEGKGKDNEWIVTYIEPCFAGEALRWYTCLDSDTQENWKKLRQALLIQYPRGGIGGPAVNLVPSAPTAASFVPAPKATLRGRIKISNSSSSTIHYLSKSLPSGKRVVSTSSIADALELEWSISSDGLQTLSIPGSQIPGYNLLGVKWRLDDTSQQNKFGFALLTRRQIQPPYLPFLEIY